MIGGFENWDAKHFLHIAKHGYIYEHSSAFFPLYPLLIRLLSRLVPFYTLSAVILNFLFFNLANVYLYKLTLLFFNGNQLVSIYTVLAFSFQPASIFFSAAYSESLYSFLTFAFIYYLHKSRDYLILSRSLLFLACLTRSNGLLNFGYLVHLQLQEFFNSRHFLLCGKNLACLITNLFASFLVLSSSFLSYQYYIYLRFCSKYFDPISIDEALIVYSKQNGYRMASLDARPGWCYRQIPISYSSIQTIYWNNGFLAYWQMKQIPNFFLAGPCIFLSVYSLKIYFNSFDDIKYSCYELFGIFSQTSNRRKSNFCFNKNLFPFAVHLIVLLFSSCIFMNIQVSFNLTHFKFL